MSDAQPTKAQLVAEVRVIEYAAAGRELTAGEAARLEILSREINRLDAADEAADGWIGQ
jgi:hypothetical protein